MVNERVKPSVSVCIVTYNSASDIADCLEAVFRQTYPIGSVVVVDNASADSTRDVVNSFGVRVQLIANTSNNGFAGGQNQAIAQTSSDFVLVLNPDVVLDPGYVEAIVSFMRSVPDGGSATGQLVLADKPDVMDSAGLAMSLTRQVRDLAAGEPAAAWGERREVFGVSGAAAVYARRMMKDIEWNGQFFDEDFFAYKEDVDVAWRARRLGWKAYYVPEAKAIHKRGWKKGGRRSIPLFVRRHSYQNRFFALIKNEPAGWHWLYLIPLLGVYELAKLAYIAVREPRLLGCWPVIVRSFPRQLSKRRWLIAKVKEKLGKS